MFRRSHIARTLAVLFTLALACAGAFVQTPSSAQERPQDPATSRPRRAGADEPAQQQPAARPTPPQRDETIDDDEVLRVETDLTNVLFTATDKNKRFITSIRQEDIEVYEDGVRQEIFTFQRETDRPLSLAILIDTSNSQERTLPDEKRAASAFVDAVIRPTKDEVAVLTFTGETTLEQSLTGNPSRVRRAIDRVEFVPPSGYLGGGVIGPGDPRVSTPPISGTNQRLAGSTAIWDSIWVTAREVLSESSDKTRRAIILLSDGVDTISQLKMQEAIDAAIKADAIIYSIGIGDNFFDGVDQGSMKKVAERTGGRAYFPQNEEDLRSAFAQIQQELRSQYLVAYSPTKKAKDGSYRQVRIDVVNPDLKRQSLRLTYRQGYFSQAVVAPASAGRQ
jgi:Ca-activated chloride channel family protein